MPRFVVLEHDHPFLHWDLMLEDGETLRTWRLSAPLEHGPEIAAEPLGNHRRIYLDYEGPLSGKRGTVRRVDFGTFTWLKDSRGEVEIALGGQRITGTARLYAAPTGEWKLHVRAGD